MLQDAARMQPLRLGLSLLACVGCIPAASFEQIPIAESFAYFEQNVGQADSNVRYLVRGAQRMSLAGDSLSYLTDRRSTVTVRFAPAVEAPEIEPLDEWPGILNLFDGPENEWKRDIPAFRRVQYTGVRPNIDLIFSQTLGADVSGASSSLTMSFVVRPGADVGALFLENESEGAGTQFDPQQGDWVAEAAGGFGVLYFRKPRAWQESAGTQAPVEAAFVARSDLRVGIETASYDRSRPLRIEVDVVTFVSRPEFRSFAVDASGNVYAAASIQSQEICRITTGGTSQFCSDAAVVAFDPSGAPIFFSTLSGVASDSVWNIVLDTAGDLVIAGLTDSGDFPVTADAYQADNAGPLGPAPSFSTGDLFLARLKAASGDLMYSTFFGGPEGEGGISLSVSSGGVALAAGTGKGFPTSPGAWMTEPPCPVPTAACSHQVAARFDESLTRLEYATFLPGKFFRPPLAVHSDGSVYVAGSAEAETFTTPGALQREFGGASDAYLVRLSPDGSRPLFATYFGDDEIDSANGLVLDEQGNARLLVHKTVEGPFSAESSSDVVAWIAADGSALLSSQTLASPFASPALFRESAGGIILFGAAYSPVLPTSEEAPLRGSCSKSDHAYVTRWGTDGTQLFATYLPQQSESLSSLVLGPSGLLYLRDEHDFTRIDLDAPNRPAVQCVTGAASRRNSFAVSPGEIVTILGAGMGPLEGVGADPTAAGHYPLELAGVRVWVDGAPAPLLYVDSSQVNAVIPYRVSPETRVTVEVRYEGRQLPIVADVVHAGVGLFTLDASGSGQAAALNEDGTLNSQSNPAALGSIVVLYGTGIGAVSPPLPDGGLGPLGPPEELPSPTGLVQVLIDRFLLDVLYAGAAPGLVNGAAQFNIRIPPALPLPEGPQAVRVDIHINGAPPDNSATVWVRE